MTENKRFRVFKYPDCKEYGVSDDVADCTLARFDYHFEAELLSEILNELNDEVKSQSLVLKRYQRRNEKLFNENKQLKEEVETLQEELAHFIGDFE